MEPYEIENPISISQIEPNLYLGNATAASNTKTLDELQITHILSIDSVPLVTHITDNPKYTNKFIRAADVPKEDLLQRFDECLGFIEAAINGGGTVLVHCYYGVSRSATIVIAYLMKKYKSKYDKAFERAKSKRTLVQPNTGFIQQLRLFHRMGFKIDARVEHYKIYRLRLAADKIKKAKILEHSFLDVVKPDPDVTQENPEPLTFRCKRCRRILAAKSHLLTHKTFEDNGASTSTNQMVADVERLLQASSLNSDHSEKSVDGGGQICKMAYFFEPIAWMVVCGILNNTQGRLTCPKCSHKLGSFNWVLAVKCPCGKQVQPAFYILPSRVDQSNVVQNVQVTV